MTEVPHLETARLLLRAHVAADWEDLAATWAHPAVAGPLGWSSSRRDSWMRLLRYRGLWDVLGYGYWCVCERETGRYVGDVGFGDWRRNAEPALPDMPEAGWVLAPWAHGRGLATEAMIAALSWADRERCWPEVMCILDGENAASVRVATKLGFSPRGEVSFEGRPTRLLVRGRGARLSGNGHA